MPITQTTVIIVAESPRDNPVPDDGRDPIDLDIMQKTVTTYDDAGDVMGVPSVSRYQYHVKVPPENQTVVNFAQLIGLMGESVFARLEKEAKARGNSPNQDEIALMFLEKAKFQATDVTKIDRELDHFETEGYITAADVTRIKAGIPV